MEKSNEFYYIKTKKKKISDSFIKLVKIGKVFAYNISAHK